MDMELSKCKNLGIFMNLRLYFVYFYIINIFNLSSNLQLPINQNRLRRYLVYIPDLPSSIIK